MPLHWVVCISVGGMSSFSKPSKQQQCWVPTRKNPSTNVWLVVQFFPPIFLEAPWVEAESVREDIFRTNIHNTFAFRNCVSKSRSWECSRMETTVIRTRSGWNHCMLVACGERHSWWVWNCACISIYCIYISMHIQILCVWLFFLFDSWITKPDAVWNSWRL